MTDWHPMPKGGMVLPVGAEMKNDCETIWVLTSEGIWVDGSLKPCSVRDRDDFNSREEGVQGTWPTHYRVDYPWRVWDQNDNYKAWETVVNRVRYEAVSVGSATNCQAARVHDWRVELGSRGYAINHKGVRSEFGFEPRAVTPAPAPAPPPCPDPVPVQRWPNRAERVAMLGVELATPLSERLLRVKR